MEKIKSIRKLKNNQYIITTESGMKFRASEDSLVKHRLLKGQEVTSELLEEVKRESELHIGYQLALNYLNYQLRSEKEIKDHLKKKEISDESIHYTMERLVGLGLVNDRVYAESYVRTMIRTSDKGPSVVKQQLKKRGIEEEDILGALALYTVEDQEELALKQAEKAIRKYRQQSHHEQLSKTRQLLFTKGYSSDVIQLVMGQLEVEKDQEEEEDLLAKQGDKLWQRHRRLEPFKRKQKIKQSLYQKGFNFDDINHYLEEKELEENE